MKISLKKDIVLSSIVDELKKVHHCHTIILYGSRARGDHTPTSDYDVAGISKSDSMKRIARFDAENNVYHDIFIYPEHELLAPEHLKLADGVVLFEKDDFGSNLLSKLTIMKKIPEAISSDEIQTRKIWYKKMLSRAAVKDLEGRYRHIWSIFSLLEDYFVFNGMRYEGPKKAFNYLEKFDPETLALFSGALSNPSCLDSLERLIQKIVS